MEVRKMCLRAGALVGVLAVGSAAAVVASGAGPATIRSKTATTYTWSNPKNVNNRACAGSTTLWKLDEQLTGTSSGDPQEAGVDQVHITGVADTTNGNGFLQVDLHILTGPGGTEIAHEQGVVVLSNQNRTIQGGTNAVNGLLAGDAHHLTSGTTTYPDADVYTNITGSQGYTGGSSSAPLVIPSITGVMGGSGPTRAQFQTTQNGVNDDNAGVFVPDGAC